MISILLRFTQFFPLALFLYFSKAHGWSLGFKIGAIAAIVQTALLVLRAIPISRLLAGANLFLMVGAFAFVFEIDFLLSGMSMLMETFIFVCLIFVFVTATLFTKTGAFEVHFTDPEKTRKYSLVLIVLAVACAVWSYLNRGLGPVAGAYPFIVLLVTKTFLQRKLTQ